MLAILFSAIPLTSFAADQKAAKISVNASVDDNRAVTGNGVLTTNNNKPISGAQVHIAIGGTSAVTVTTAENGSFNFAFIIGGTATGKFEISAKFDGSSAAKGASATTTIKTKGAEAGKLSLSVDTTEAFAGQLVGITGKLQSDSGSGIGGALITFDANGTQDTDATTATASDGSYSTYLVIPENSGSSVTITATFAGNGDVGGASNSTKVKVTLDNLEEESASPSSTPSKSKDDESSAAAEPSDSVTVTSAAASQLADTASAEAGEFPWLLVGFLAVAALGVGITAALVLRERRRHGSEAAASESGESMLDGFSSQD